MSRNTRFFITGCLVFFFLGYVTGTAKVSNKLTASEEKLQLSFQRAQRVLLDKIELQKLEIRVARNHEAVLVARIESLQNRDQLRAVAERHSALQQPKTVYADDPDLVGLPSMEKKQQGFPASNAEYWETAIRQEEESRNLDRRNFVHIEDDPYWQ